MKNKNKKEISWFIPFFLFLILCILITGVKIFEFYKKEEIPIKKEEIIKKGPIKREEVIKKEKVIKREKKIPGKKVPVAIIIDDCGWSKSVLKEFKNIDCPLTLSILPKAPYSKEIVKDLEKENFEFILHLPLQPLPPNQCLDKGLITTDMSPEEIKKVFYEDINDFLPYIKGINNHMGSFFTSNPEKMEVLLDNVKEENLFFIDSVTSTETVGYELAKQKGIKTIKRDIFIDNETNPEYIKSQLERLVEIAKENGKAVAIGHAKSTTLKVLKETLPELEKQGIEIVPVSSIVE